MGLIEVAMEQLADVLAAQVVELDDRDRRIARSLYDLLADGDPVTLGALGDRARVSPPVVEDVLARWPGVFRDESGAVVGFWGLSISPTAHRFEAQGGKPIHAWCALDPFLVVPAIGRPARVESTDPVNGEAVTMTVRPDGVRDLEPSAAVMSVVVPHEPFGDDVIHTFCHSVLNFTSFETAETWAAEREGIGVLPVADAFEVGRRVCQVLLAGAP